MASSSSAIPATPPAEDPAYACSESQWPTDPEYTWWWAAYRMNTTWWPSPPPPAMAILEAMKTQALELRPRAPILQPPVTTTQIKEHDKMWQDVFDNTGSEMQAHKAVLADIERVTSINRSGEIFDDPRMRRGQAGLGYEEPVLRGRNLAKKETWDNVGHPAKFVQLFSWNAGNLQRMTRGDTLKVNLDLTK